MRTTDIQKEILRRLLKATILRYRDMKPADVANDLYNYHLQFLVQKGYVTKDTNGYALSPKGIKYIADEKPLNPEGEWEDLFKLNVVTIIHRTTGDTIEVLVQSRTRHPSYGDTYVPGGAIRKGELWEGASVRTVKRETGLIVQKLQLLAVARRVLYDNKENVAMDNIYHIVIAGGYEGELLQHTDYGENKWISIDEAINIESTRSISLPIMIDILSALKNGTLKKWKIKYEEYSQRTS